jgi:hypothetical protein
MKRIQLWQILAIVAIILLVGINEDMFSYPHRCRFEKFMKINKIEYSDAGCEYGWDMTNKFKPWSGPNGKNRLQKIWNEIDSISKLQSWELNPWGALVDSMDVKYEYGEPTYRNTIGDITEFEYTFEGYNFMFVDGLIVSFKTGDKEE